MVEPKNHHHMLCSSSSPPDACELRCGEWDHAGCGWCTAAVWKPTDEQMVAMGLDPEKPDSWPHHALCSKWFWKLRGATTCSCRRFWGQEAKPQGKQMPVEKYRVTVSAAMGFSREGYADTYDDAVAMSRRFTEETGKPAVIAEAEKGMAGWLYRVMDRLESL